VIEVTITDSTGIVNSAEAETPEAAMYAARVIYGESLPYTMGARPLTVGFYVDGKLVRQVEGRP
jgi:hypothetical protein